MYATIGDNKYIKVGQQCFYTILFIMQLQFVVLLRSIDECIISVVVINAKPVYMRDRYRREPGRASLSQLVNNTTPTLIDAYIATCVRACVCVWLWICRGRIDRTTYAFYAHFSSEFVLNAGSCEKIIIYIYEIVCVS